MMAAHESPRTTKLYDRTSDAVSLIPLAPPSRRPRWRAPRRLVAAAGWVAFAWAGRRCGCARGRVPASVRPVPDAGEVLAVPYHLLERLLDPEPVGVADHERRQQLNNWHGVAGDLRQDAVAASGISIS